MERRSFLGGLFSIPFISKRDEVASNRTKICRSTWPPVCSYNMCNHIADGSISFQSSEFNGAPLTVNFCQEHYPRMRQAVLQGFVKVSDE